VSQSTGASAFRAKFMTRAQALRYRDRYITGRRARTDRLERGILRRLLAGLGPLEVIMDLPGGAGRLAPVFAEVARRVIVADASPQMLQLAREDLAGLPVEYLETEAERTGLPDASVDLLFSHRYLHHIHASATRARVFAEFARVSRRYVLLSYYSPGFRDRWSWLRARLGLRDGPRDRPATQRRFLAEAAATGLRLIRRQTLRRFPLVAAFYLFEHDRATDLPPEATGGR
jgi:hypothetical protein